MPTPAAATPDADEPAAVSRVARGAGFALLVLFSMNLLNYVDRFVFAAVGPAIMADLEVGPSRFGLLGSAFIVVYTIVSPGVGWLGDRASRRKLLAFGVGLWSLATVGSAFAADFGQMFAARALLGVGEASYGVVAPTLLADLYPPRLRGRVMGLFYLALPMGTAVGYAVGGLAQTAATEHAEAIRSAADSAGMGWLAPSLVGWRAAFWVVGLPGLVLAALGMAIRDPGRGASEGVRESSRPAARPGLADYLAILRTPSYLFNTLGMAAITFTIGAYGHWMPTYFQYVHKTLPKDNLVIGLGLALAGIAGVLIGMWLPDRLARRTRRAYLIWAAGAVLVAIPFGAAGLLASDRWSALGLLFFASVTLTSCLGPCNSVTADVVPSDRRAVGYAMSIFLLHLLGDIPSPPLIGEISARLAVPEVRASDFGRLLDRLGTSVVDPADLPIAPSASLDDEVIAPVSDADEHGPHDAGRPADYAGGMLVIIPCLLLGSLAFALGAWTLPRDRDRALALSAGHPAGPSPPAFH